jgi:hypothetical protein
MCRNIIAYFLLDHAMKPALHAILNKSSPTLFLVVFFGIDGLLLLLAERGTERD